MAQGARDVVVIGSGPAGLTAAIYLARAGLIPTVLTGPNPGGQLVNTDMIENFPGFTSIRGADLMMQILSQTEACGAELIYEPAESISVHDGLFKVTLPQEPTTPAATIHSRSVLIATGARHRHLGIPGEAEFINRGVSWCATCDGPMYKGKRVAVVGGGNSAVMEALFLSSFAATVTLIHRRDSLRADDSMQKRLFAKNNVNLVWNTELAEILGSSKVESLRLKDRLTNEETMYDVDGVFIAVGTVPTSELVRELVQCDEDGYIIADDTQTSCNGLFAAGDVVSNTLKQAVYAAGQGALAARQIETFLGIR
ncbi:MAG: thioredoxin-disulfide reductase [Holosporales bacterium]|jgi:thioredoxin reductase (NADPH)|nr:thioredoxin-disulfide reductase [Holosporales bacterium]